MNRNQKNTRLSIVVTSRNDSHFGELKNRMRIFVKSITTQMALANSDMELVIIEWNPEKGAKRLKEILSNNFARGNYKVKIITVPDYIHQKIKNSGKINLFQYHAKNVGIRRASGDFILSTNIDIIFSIKLFKSLLGQLQENNIYRALRYDISPEISPDWNPEQIQDFSGSNLLRCYLPWATEKITSRKNNFFTKLNLYIKWKISSNKAFSNACGDFTLMHKKYWEKIRGYPELPYYGAKIDGLCLFQALKAGARQITFPPSDRIYHIDHEGTWTSENKNAVENRLRQAGIPYINGIKYAEYVKRIMQNKGLFLFNDNDWGLRGIDLKEENYG